MTARRRRPSPLRRLMALSVPSYVAAVVLVVALAVLVAVLANPGHRFGPVQPARPPVPSGPSR